MRLHLALCIPVIALALACGSPVVLGAPVTSPHQACLVLKRTAVEKHLSIHDLSGRYYCECGPYPSPDYFVCALRYTLNVNDDAGSNLIGYFGIRASDGRVFDWDFSEDKPLPLAERPPFQK